MIQKAKITDIPSIMTCFKAAVKKMNNNGFYNWNDVYPNQETAEKDITAGTLYIAIVDKEVIGIVTIDENQDPLYATVDWQYKGNKSLVIHRLAVHPKVQGQGWGKKLLAFAEELGISLGYGSIRLDALKIGTARFVYESMKYTYISEIWFTPEGQDKDYPFLCYEKVV